LLAPGDEVVEMRKRTHYRGNFAAALTGLLLTLLLLTPLWPREAKAADGKRVALVVGNSAYQHVELLLNPANDANGVGAALRTAGFDDVEVIQDITRNSFVAALRKFATAAAEADIAVVYFAGHGIEVSGVNYLIPTDARLATNVDVQDEAISLDRVLASLEGAKRLRLVVLDACRNNPFVSAMRRISPTRSIGRGLAKVEPEGSDTLIAFAAKAGSTALDGTNGNSPFARSIIAHLTEPGLDVRIAFGRVRDAVLRDTARQQEPFLYGSLGGATISLVPSNDRLRADKASPPFVSGAAAVSEPVAERRSDDDAPKASAIANGDALAAEARSFVARLHSVMAESDAAALAVVRSVYSEPANFYGKLTAPGTVLAEKRRFLERWPVRRYVPRPGATTATCDSASSRCQVTGIVDYEVLDPIRGTHTVGSSTFEYDMRLLASRVVILREDGKVIRASRLSR
jgi:uncharacterized caspase-like protein